MSELLREQVYQELKADILAGLYGVGERLSVDELAKKHKVSKTPVKEALTALQKEELVEIIPRVGYFISQLTVKDIRDIFELRLIVEAASAEMAARNILDEELRDLENMHASYVSGDIDGYWQYLQANREFHCRVALATRNKWLAEVVGRLLDQMQRLLFLRLDLRNSADEMVEEHRQLVAALRKRDAALARKVMVDAIENARQAVLEAIIRGATCPIQPST
ncbi:MAG: GntR family transcriptional regulator [Chloroflexota bacterium]